MPKEDDEAAAARRRARRDRTKSPAPEQDDDSEEVTATRRKSYANISASKLMESLQATSEAPITRLRRGQSTDGTQEKQKPSGRRTPGRTMSAQASRANPRRMRSGDADMLSQSMMENTHGDMDGSNMSASASRRRGPPQRTRSADNCLPRGVTQRTPRARRRPERQDSVEADEDGMMSSSRRRPPGRTKSVDAMPPRGAGARAARSGRRRPNLDDDDDDVIISDSSEEEEEEDLEGNRHSNHLDRSSASTGVSSRRGIPRRTRSTDSGGVPTTRGQRTARTARRRPSAERSDASPKRSGGPGFQRSLTAAPGSASGSGPGLHRSNTATNPRSRNRGGRNTAAELAQVSVSNRERSPDPSIVSFEGNDMESAKESLKQLGSKHSVSPIKSRQERRHLREAKEREALERRIPQKAPLDDEEPEPLVAEKKEEPWMRRLKKSGGASKSAEDSFSFDEAVRQKADVFNSSQDKGFFPTDPTFGVFAAGEPLTDMNSSFENGDGSEDAMVSIMETKQKNKLDFSSIS
ncbi:expressed unknown protein [Seminavis robusta]|uniref:Uncharacterized protein n=1 Tax=Seminavis robusta TaxID=568900 RepID=A0A9N8DMM7_9STRA|nr:expressed unknown protein [Seminavis robusta]|eukprot:Sro246_g097700.1 n/a (523) ;mRNA; f:40241-41809